MPRSRTLALLFLLAATPLRAQETAAVAAVVTGAVENVYLRPDETAPVDNQAVLGERLDAVTVMFALVVMAVVFIGKRLPADRLPAVAR